MIALDPDIPMARQRVGVAGAGGVAGLRLDVDGRALPLSEALWPPLPGAHYFRLRGADGRVLDRALVTVR